MNRASRTSRSWRAAGIGLFAVLVLAVNFLVGGRSSKQNVTLETVRRSDLVLSVTAPGEIELQDERLLICEVNEKIIRKSAQEGAAVKAGDVLLEFSQDNTQLEFMQAQSNFNTVKSNYQKALSEHNIEDRLFRKGAVAKSELDEAHRQLEQARYALQLEIKKFELAKERREKVVVRAPLDGVIIKDFLQKLDKVKAGDSLFSVGDLNRQQIRLHVDEIYVSRISTGQPVEIRSDTFSGKVISGHVASIAAKAQKEGFARVDVIVAIDNAPGIKPKPAMSVRGDIIQGTLAQAIHIPLQAVKERNQNNYVLVANFWGRLSEREVRLGRNTSERVEITQGLKPGERFVAADAFLFKNGDFVSLRPSGN